MNLLFTFLKAVPEDWLAYLPEAGLSPTELLVCQEMVFLLPQEEPEKDHFLQKIQLTDSHFFKISSTSLQKLYHYFFPEPIELIENLARLHLPEHLKKAYEKTIKTKQDSRFYQIALDAFLGMPLKDLSIPYSEKIAETYLQSLPEITPADFAYVRLRFSTTEIYSVLLPAKGKSIEEFTQIKTQYAEEIADLRKTKGLTENTLAWYAWNRAYGLFQVQLSNDQEGILALQVCQEIASQPGNPLTKREIVRASCRLAEVYYFENQPEIAWNEYETIRNSHPVEFAMEPYHQTKFIQLSLIIGKISFAGALLDTYFPWEKHQNWIMPVIHHAKYLLMKPDLQKAHETILKGFEINKKKSIFSMKLNCGCWNVSILCFLEMFKWHLN